MFGSSNNGSIVNDSNGGVVNVSKGGVAYVKGRVRDYRVNITQL